MNQTIIFVDQLYDCYLVSVWETQSLLMLIMYISIILLTWFDPFTQLSPIQVQHQNPSPSLSLSMALVDFVKWFKILDDPSLCRFQFKTKALSVKDFISIDASLSELDHCFLRMKCKIEDLHMPKPYTI